MQTNTHSNAQLALQSAPSFAKKTFFFLTAGVLLLTGCKKEPEPVTPVGSVTADAGADQAVEVGQTVTLDGGTSKDSQGKSLTFAWSLLRKPAKSTATLANATTAKPTLKTDEIGEYELELSVTSANGKSTDKVLVTASTSQPLTINEGFRVKTELIDRVANPELPDYIVAKNIGVNAELTIKPGVVIAFERDVRMDINSDGLVIAQGEANKKIRFIGVQKTKGFWVGIANYSRSNANILEHVEVMHAGSRPIFSTTKSALFISGSQSQLALKNTTFSQNEGYGLYVYGGGILREFSHNTFTNNSEAGIMVDPENVAKLDVASTFTGGNGRNVVEITSGGIKNSPNEVVWTGFADKSPYQISGDFAVNAAWKINPGVTLQMTRDAIIRINSDGYISAKGTPTEKITFTGASRTAGFWKGLICYSADSKNVIENAEISYAGSNVIVSGKKANLAIYGNRSTLTVKNTQISNSGGYGVFVSYGASINTDVTTANAFEANAQTNVLIEK